MCVTQLNNLKKKLTRHLVTSKSFFPGTDLLNMQRQVSFYISPPGLGMWPKASWKLPPPRHWKQNAESMWHSSEQWSISWRSIYNPSYELPMSKLHHPTIPPPTRTQEGLGSKIIAIKETKILFLLSDLSWLYTATVLHLKYKNGKLLESIQKELPSHACH